MFDLAFDWLDTPSRTLNLSNEPVTHDLCLINKQRAAEQMNLARRNYVGLRFVKTTLSEVLTPAHAALLRGERYVKFLENCEMHLQREKTQSIYQLLFNIVVMEAQTKQYATAVLSAWLDKDKDAALQFYEEWLTSVLQATGNDEMLVVGTGTVCMQYLLKNLRSVLQYQTEPLALCRLSTGFIDSPLQFAACIIWILEQGGCVDALIQSKILHQFLSYYFPHFGIFEKPLNTVSLFYKILDQFPHAKLLIERARIISCDIRGFKRVNLLGNQSKDLVLAEATRQQPLLTRTVDNLKQIIVFFGERGVFHVIEELFLCSEDDFDHSFTHFMQVHNHLITPTLLQLIAEESPGTLRKIVHLIDDPFFQQWLSNKQYTILYLLPYRTRWIQSIDQEMMHSFLQTIDSIHTPGCELESVKLLLSLYEAMLAEKTSLAELVYQSLFQVVLTNRYLLDDRLLFVTLRQSPFLNRFVASETECLVDALTKNIIDFILDEDSFIDGYNDLYQHWQMLLGRFEILELLAKTPRSFPMRRADFIVSVFEQCTSMSCKPWKRLLDIMHVLPSFESTIDGYQRDILLKLLVHIDDNELQEIIISTLELTDAFFLERGRDILLNAVAKGNIGILDKYLSHHPLDHELLRQAIVSKQWTIITHWFSHYGFAGQDQEIIDLLLIEASGSKKINLLRSLIKGGDLNFSAKSVAKAFAKAASVDDPTALNYLYLLHPYPMTVKAVVTQAINDGHYNALKFFKRFKKRNEHLANGVLQGFNNALIKNDTHMVLNLMEFSSNAPSPQNIKTAKIRLEGKERSLAKKIKNKLRPVEPVSSASTNAMLQLLTRLQNPDNSVPLKEGCERRSKLPPIKSFCSTESLTRVSSSIFSSPLEFSNVALNPELMTMGTKNASNS